MRPTLERISMPSFLNKARPAWTTGSPLSGARAEYLMLHHSLCCATPRRSWRGMATIGGLVAVGEPRPRVGLDSELCDTADKNDKKPRGCRTPET